MCREHETSDIVYPMHPSPPARRQTNGPLDMLSLVCRIRRRTLGRVKYLYIFGKNRQSCCFQGATVTTRMKEMLPLHLQSPRHQGL